jgi:hypothetical protein
VLTSKCEGTKYAATFKEGRENESRFQRAAHSFMQNKQPQKQQTNSTLQKDRKLIAKLLAKPRQHTASSPSSDSHLGEVTLSVILAAPALNTGPSGL